MHYCLQQHLETGANVDSKTSGLPRLTSVAAHRHFIVSSKRNSRKSVLLITTELNSPHKHRISVMTEKCFFSVGLKLCVSVKKHLE